MHAAAEWTKALGPPLAVVTVSRDPDEDTNLSEAQDYLSTYGATLVYSYIIQKGWDVNFIGTGERGRESTDAVAEAAKWRFSGRAISYYRFLDPLTDEPTPVQGELSVEYRGKQTDDQSSEYENWRATVGVRFDF